MYGLLNRFFNLEEGGHITVHDVMSAFSVLFFSLQSTQRRRWRTINNLMRYFLYLLEEILHGISFQKASEYWTVLDHF